MKRLTKALIISTTYLAVGNLIAINGMQHPTNAILNAPLIEMLFAPYTFVGGMSAFAGWDWLSFLLETIIFIITIPFFFSLMIVVEQIKNKVTHKDSQ